MSARRAHLAGTIAFALAAIAASTPAAAQSTRHPKPPIDVEAEDEAKSEFWEEVVRPGAKRHEDLVKASTDILRMRNPGDANLKRAREMLIEATTLRGDLVEGWGYLGVTIERQTATIGQKSKATDWKPCADAYGKAYAIDPTWRPKRLLTKSDPSTATKIAGNRPLELAWATCLARAGEIERATGPLEALVARGEATQESWMRLGEVYMAAGRLHEAITALEQARNDRMGGKRERWLLAMAYDRARRPGEADAIAADAGDIIGVTSESVAPFVPASDSWYLQAFGWRHRPGRSLALFRMYLAKTEPESLWRARAQEHIEALVDIDFATHVDLQGTGDRAAIEKVVRTAMPALRRCVASVPEVYIELRITQMGPVKALPPPKPITPPKRVGHYRPPGPVMIAPRSTTLAQPGVFAEPQVFEPGVNDTARNQALECLEKLGMSLSLPRPPANAYSTVRIPVVAAD